MDDIKVLPMVPIPRKIKEIGFKCIERKYFIDFEELMKNVFQPLRYIFKE